MKTVLFACVHNAGRSQMAAAWFNRLADPTKAVAISAGTEPGRHVHPEVVQAMSELGIDLSNQSPKFLSDELARSASTLITMGCGEACPVVPGVRRDDWPLEDPKGKSLDRVREIRSEIATRVRALLIANDWLRWMVRDARPEDRAQAEALLRTAGLPTVGVADHFESFIVAENTASRMVGVAGIEMYGTSGLLRSVATEASVRGSGLGSMLTARMIARARAKGVVNIYLLTTTAEAFFAKQGFERIERVALPAAIQSSAELNGLCPESATVMRLRG